MGHHLSSPGFNPGVLCHSELRVRNPGGEALGRDPYTTQNTTEYRKTLLVSKKTDQSLF